MSCFSFFPDIFIFLPIPFCITYGTASMRWLNKIQILQISLLSGQDALQFQLLHHLISARLQKSDVANGKQFWPSKVINNKPGETKKKRSVVHYRYNTAIRFNNWKESLEVVNNLIIQKQIGNEDMWDYKN